MLILANLSSFVIVCQKPYKYRLIQWPRNEICFINEKLWINWKHNQKLRKYLSLRLDSKLDTVFNNLQIQSMWKFKNNLKFLFHYQNYFNNYTSCRTVALRPNRAHLFVHNKYTVFTMGGTVASIIIEVVLIMKQKFWIVFKIFTLIVYATY